MVYLNLSVGNIEETISYYVEKLGIFDYEAGRLVCKYGVDLIIDILEVGSKAHNEVFEQDVHVMSSFWIHVGESVDGYELQIKDRLASNRVKYQEVGNLGGHCLNFTDPSGNKFSLHAHHSVIK
jgi:hypothetical protein